MAREHESSDRMQALHRLHDEVNREALALARRQSGGLLASVPNQVAACWNHAVSLDFLGFLSACVIFGALLRRNQYARLKYHGLYVVAHCARKTGHTFIR